MHPNSIVSLGTVCPNNTLDGTIAGAIAAVAAALRKFRRVIPIR
jgi:hypothetical protein